MKIRLEDMVWVINDGEYYIKDDDELTYIVTDYNSEEIYYTSDNFEKCLVWLWNTI